MQLFASNFDVTIGARNQSLSVCWEISCVHHRVELLFAETATQERFLGQICIFIACQNQLVRESVTPAVNQSLSRRHNSLWLHALRSMSRLLFNWIAIPIVSLRSHSFKAWCRRAPTHLWRARTGSAGKNICKLILDMRSQLELEMFNWKLIGGGHGSTKPRVYLQVNEQ